MASGTGAVYLAVQQGDAERLERANELGRQGRYAEALDEALAVERAPAADRAALTAAYALFELRRYPEAARAFAQAAEADPRNWVIHRDRARALLASGRRGRAERAMARARELNPRMTVPPGFQAATRAGGG